MSLPSLLAGFPSKTVIVLSSLQVQQLMSEDFFQSMVPSSNSSSFILLLLGCSFAQVVVSLQETRDVWLAMEAVATDAQLVKLLDLRIRPASYKYVKCAQLYG